MKQNIFLGIKVFLFCFFILIVQIALVEEFRFSSVNLVFGSLIVFSSILSTTEVILGSVFFTVFSAMLFYNGDILWVYPIVAIGASKFNPEQIPDKFLLCLIYTILLTPVLEIFNPSSLSYLEKVSEGILVNLVSIIPLFFLVKFIFYKREEKIQLPL